MGATMSFFGGATVSSIQTIPPIFPKDGSLEHCELYLSLFAILISSAILITSFQSLLSREHFFA